MNRFSSGRSAGSRPLASPLGESLESKCLAALARVDEIMLAGISQGRLRVTRNPLRQMTDAMREHENGRRVTRRGAKVSRAR